MFFIPVLMATFIGMFLSLPAYGYIDTPFGVKVPIGLASGILLFMSVWYIYLDPISGIVSSLVYISQLFLMLHLQAHWSYEVSFLHFCAGVNIVSWIA